jgi:hypothetical protein
VKRLSIAVAVAFAAWAALAATAHADGIQKSGMEQWPGKFQVGAHVLGGQFGFTGYEPSGLRFDFDFAGRLKDFSKFSLWLGGGFHYTAGGLYNFYVGFQHELGFWAFVEISLDKLITQIPLVPYVRAGLEGGLLYYGAAGGFFDLRILGGIHYWITKNIGLGGEMGISAGFGAYPTLNTFYGVYTATLGARFAF